MSEGHLARFFVGRRAGNAAALLAWASWCLVGFVACSPAAGPRKPGAGTGGTGGDPPAGGTGGSGGVSGGQGGAGGRGGVGGAGGMTGSGGSVGQGGGGGTGGQGGRDAGPSADGAAATDGARAEAAVASEGGTGMPLFSFFVTSLEAMQRLSNNMNGFGGDLRYGEETGIAGADKICTEIAESAMPGSGAKGWRAFLSAAVGPAGGPEHAIDRIGEGPWYDRRGRLVAMQKADLLAPRPRGAHMAIANDLPNENGLPNRYPNAARPTMEVDNHHVLTGSNAQGRLQTGASHCDSWRNKTTDASAGRPRCGFSWSIQNRIHWISGLDEAGCGAGINLVGGGGPDPGNRVVGSGGGYGGIYCFALKP